MDSFLSLFLFTLAVILITKRMSVTKDILGRSSLQAFLLVIGYKVIRFLLKVYSNVMETFTPVSEVGKPMDKSLVLDHHPGTSGDFNQEFDLVGEKAQEDQTDTDGETLRIKTIGLDTLKNKHEVLEDYNHLQPGYTFQSPTTFRTPESQPPICLTDKPCQTQPVVISTSMGTEFLPYAKIKSSIQIEGDLTNQSSENSVGCSKTESILQT